MSISFENAVGFGTLTEKTPRAPEVGRGAEVSYDLALSETPRRASPADARAYRDFTLSENGRYDSAEYARASRPGLARLERSRTPLKARLRRDGRSANSLVPHETRATERAAAAAMTTAMDNKTYKVRVTRPITISGTDPVATRPPARRRARRAWLHPVTDARSNLRPHPLRENLRAPIRPARRTHPYLPSSFRAPY